MVFLQFSIIFLAFCYFLYPIYLASLFNYTYTTLKSHVFPLNPNAGPLLGTDEVGSFYFAKSEAICKILFLQRIAMSAAKFAKIAKTKIDLYKLQVFAKIL